MYTIILGFALAMIFGVLMAVLINKWNHDVLAMVSMCLMLLSGFIAVIMLVSVMVIPARVNTFIKQKAYIESIDFDEFQSAGITLAKIEQNDWLYTAQFTRERFGDWGPYPETVLDLEPIE